MGEALLLDTHTLVWWLFEPANLSSLAETAISEPDNVIYVSPVSAMEIATKVRKGKFELARPLAEGFAAQMRNEDFRQLAISFDHAELAGSLGIRHKDPWDRLLAAQARIERMRIVSIDPKLDQIGAIRLW